MLASGGKMSAFGPASRFGFIHDVFGVPAVDDKLEISNTDKVFHLNILLKKILITYL